ncbi:MAG: MBL fold metallo-hydrolase [Acidimicrobiales bacterium]|nr:MBL fold metallo-hydrolase [Acidimicrobiales bacterium]
MGGTVVRRRLQLDRVDNWWTQRRISERITLLSEPHVTEFLRCNVWHIRGQNCDLVVDTGLGLAPLVPLLDLSEHSQVVVVLTHTHADHAGGWDEFDERYVHHLEAHHLDPQTGAPDLDTLWAAALEEAEHEHMSDAGYDIPDCFVTALPAGFPDVETLPFRPATATRLLDEGDRIDLGDRAFEILHLPGHSPGSIGLIDRDARLLISGDAIYDGPLLDGLPGSDISAYLHTMDRLRGLDVELTLPGHGEPFGGERLHAIAAEYLRKPTNPKDAHP